MHKRITKVILPFIALLVVGCASPCKKRSKVVKVIKTQNRAVKALINERMVDKELAKIIAKSSKAMASEQRLVSVLKQLSDSNSAILQAYNSQEDK